MPENPIDYEDPGTGQSPDPSFTPPFSHCALIKNFWGRHYIGIYKEAVPFQTGFKLRLFGTILIDGYLCSISTGEDDFFAWPPFTQEELSSADVAEVHNALAEMGVELGSDGKFRFIQPHPSGTDTLDALGITTLTKSDLSKNYGMLLNV